jgi:hypothetical protein
MEMLSHPGVQIALFSFPCPGPGRRIDKLQDPFSSNGERLAPFLELQQALSIF